jgi:hypothetical protein
LWDGEVKKRGDGGRLKRGYLSREYRNKALALLEMEVRQYHETKAELEEEKEGIILASAPMPDGMPRGTETSDPAFRLASRLLSSAEIRRMSKVVKAIEQARDEFCSKETFARMRFIELKFWDRRLTNEGIAEELKIAESTVRSWRKKFLVMVGVNLGWRM